MSRVNPSTSTLSRGSWSWVSGAHSAPINARLTVSVEDFAWLIVGIAVATIPSGDHMPYTPPNLADSERLRITSLSTEY